ncbi:hypothetical protein C2W64_03186 [Brevibacillus laterosporus]|nr:hypothetical protein [Brevibacillus laterosporus]RAP23087.1 hypothetical protein C2W64_03186 [Brevibacillus laterosporus]
MKEKLFLGGSNQLLIPITYIISVLSVHLEGVAKEILIFSSS